MARPLMHNVARDNRIINGKMIEIEMDLVIAIVIEIEMIVVIVIEIEIVVIDIMIIEIISEMLMKGGLKGLASDMGIEEDAVGTTLKNEADDHG
jgi:hypothetical protein